MQLRTILFIIPKFNHPEDLEFIDYLPCILYNYKILLIRGYYSSCMIVQLYFLFLRTFLLDGRWQIVRFPSIWWKNVVYFFFFFVVEDIYLLPLMLLKYSNLCMIFCRDNVVFEPLLNLDLLKSLKGLVLSEVKTRKWT